MSTATLMTAEQFAQMHTAETEDYELVDGELIPLSSGTPKHNRIRRRMERLIEDYFEKKQAGEALSETNCQLSDGTVRRPDVSVFVGGRLSEIDPNRTPVPFAPDIAIEILSPSETAIDVSRKALDYLSSGCHEVWIVDHENGEVSIRTNAGIRLLRGTDRLETPLLPGFSQAVAQLLTW